MEQFFFLKAKNEHIRFQSHCHNRALITTTANNKLNYLRLIIKMTDLKVKNVLDYFVPLKIGIGLIAADMQSFPINSCQHTQLTLLTGCCISRFESCHWSMLMTAVDEILALLPTYKQLSIKYNNRSYLIDVWKSILMKKMASYSHFDRSIPLMLNPTFVSLSFATYFIIILWKEL